MKSVLIFRASIHGWSASNFHDYCDHEGCTLVVVKDNINIFGGFTTRNWSGKDGITKGDELSFLYSVNNNQKYICKNALSGIYVHSEFGPCFGNDLFIQSDMKNDCSSNVGGSYCLPEGKVGNTLLTGNGSFIPTEIEVFKIIF